jgi:hypothetical protein
MNKWKILFIACMAVVLAMTPGYAVVKKVAQTGLQFLKIDMSPRAAAMGGAYVMVNDDATAMFYNPAGLAKMRDKMHIFSTQTQWIADISYIGIGAAYNLDNWGTFGLSYLGSNYGDDIIGTRYDGGSAQGYTETGTIDIGAYAIGLSYAKSLTDKFSIGGQVKYAYQKLGENLLPNGSTAQNEVSGLAFDLGTIFYPGFKSFRMGMSIRNFSPEFKYVQEGFELPLTFTLGFAMDVMDLMGEHKNSLIVAVDAIHPRDYTERIHLGAEYTLMEMISLRGGYKFNYDNEGLCAGVGLKKELGGVKLDIGYSYGEMEYFDAVSRISIGLAF